MQSEQIKTAFFYILIVFIATFFAFAAEKLFASGRTKTKKVCGSILFSLSFFSLFFVAAFSNCGADYESYNNVFLIGNDFSSVYGFHGMEKGFTILIFLIRKITNDVNVYNVLLALVFLMPVYRAIYKLRKITPLTWSIFIFSTLFFFQYLDLKRLFIASGIVLYGMTLWILDKKKKTSILLILIAISFHVSALLALVPIVIDFISKKKKNALSVSITVLTFLVIVILFRNELLSFSLSGRHSNYSLNTNVSFGPMQFIYFLPIIIIYAYKIKDTSDSEIAKFGYYNIIIGFSLGLFSYFYTMIGRAYPFFAFGFLIIPSILAKHKNAISWNTKFNKISLISASFIVCYCFLRTYVYFNEYLLLDQISPYTNIFGWSI